VDQLVINRQVWGMKGRRAGCDEDVVRVKVAGFTGVGLHTYGMRIDEAAGAPHDLDLMSIQVAQDRLALLICHQP